MVEQKEQKQVAIDIKRTVPLFSDNVVVANLIKSQLTSKDKEKKGKKIKKEGHITLIFIDSLTQQAVARIVISKQTAEALQKTLEESLKKFEKEIKAKETVKKTKVETIAAEKGKAKYLG